MGDLKITGTNLTDEEVSAFRETIWDIIEGRKRDGDKEFFSIDLKFDTKETYSNIARWRKK